MSKRIGFLSSSQLFLTVIPAHVQESEVIDESKAWWLMTQFCIASHLNRVTVWHDFSHFWDGGRKSGRAVRGRAVSATAASENKYFSICELKCCKSKSLFIPGRIATVRAAVVIKWLRLSERHKQLDTATAPSYWQKLIWLKTEHSAGISNIAPSSLCSVIFRSSSPHLPRPDSLLIKPE